MNRAEIKELAKEKIKGNKWNIWWPMLVIGFIEGAITGFFAPESQVNIVNGVSTINISPAYIGVSSIAGIIGGIFIAGYYKYILNFIRTGKFDFKDILNNVKEKWLDILVASILIAVIVCICSLLFVIPGIIMALAYAFAILIVVDSDTKGQDSLKASREMMKGYKWDYFVFMLSFIGWILLIPFTIGILAIWLVPYMTVAELIYYDKLKTKK